jgi:hypothetical protein
MMFRYPPTTQTVYLEDLKKEVAKEYKEDALTPTFRASYLRNLKSLEKRGLIEYHRGVDGKRHKISHVILTKETNIWFRKWLTEREEEEARTD